MKGFITAREAAELVKDGDKICCGGFIGTGVPEELHHAMEERFLSTNQPRNLTLCYAAGQGDKDRKGINRYAHEGMIKRVIGGHWGFAPKLVNLVVDNKIEGYNFPQGVITHLYRAGGGRKPFVTTHVGLGTFVDPDIEGGKMNEVTKEDLVTKVHYEGKDYLQYKSIFPDVCFLKATYADEEGNISMEKEPLFLEGFPIAIATRNNGGTVIVQVEKKLKKGTIPAKNVYIPGIIVDYVVLASDPKYHMQTFGTQYNEHFTNNAIVLEANKAEVLPLDAKKILGRRSSMLLSKKDKIVNYGIGAPEYIAKVMFEEGVDTSQFTTTIESGPVSGVPAGGFDFGVALCPSAIIEQPYMFDYYDGGGIDFAFLGLAECDSKGNINVSRFGTRIAGCGGFINITQNAKRLAFLGTFTAGGLEVSCVNGELKILQEGKNKKFVSKVGQITFSGKTAQDTKQEVYYVTERAVFKLLPEGMALIEIAPGVDLDKDVLALMDFKPIVAKDIKTMDKRIFTDALMNLSI